MENSFELLQILAQFGNGAMFTNIGRIPNWVEICISGLAMRHGLQAKIGGSQEGKDKATLLRGKKEPTWNGHTAYHAITSTDKLRKLNLNHKFVVIVVKSHLPADSGWYEL